MISHMKNLYAQKLTKERFFIEFLHEREESLDSVFSQWYKANTFNLPIQYFIYRFVYGSISPNQSVSPNSPTTLVVDRLSSISPIGTASPYVLTLNIMDRFDKKKWDGYTYQVYSHERGHNMGYPHSSGLTYGWDEIVGKLIHPLFRSAPPSQPVSEHSNVYLYYDKNTDKIYAYSRSNTIKYIDNVSFIYPTMNKNLSISTNGDEIQVHNNQIQHNGDYTPVPSILVSAKLGEKQDYNLLTYTDIYRRAKSARDKKSYNLITPAKFSIDFKAFNDKGVEISKLPPSGPVVFKITSGDIPIKNQTFEVQYQKFYLDQTFYLSWGWVKVGDCMIESGHSINCTVKHGGSKESRPYKYRVIRKSDGKVISKTITLDD